MAQNKAHSPIVMAFSGRSNSGKTTLICKLCEYISAQKHTARIAVIKHDPKDKAVFDTQGKDSYKFFQRANAVAVISPTRITMQAKIESSNATLTQKNALNALLADFKDYDYIFIEGLRDLSGDIAHLRRIVVARGEVDSIYIPYASAFAIDESVKNAHIIPSHIKILDINHIAHIARYIDVNL
ncbi:molybdopterin-guanine dinucleotide biosynthesis protein B [Helicobacter jaachi]|uniref:Molybdopterin-guanine dinucleotide biosynthesis protein B n=1 Tax=Helicobacter jaachi TaxID=1677920 RepID=A0A4U8T8Y1_9HELI|nr:molybdopterin-guanine dinucleotide biosynthesis protein B [Helicobacter jaachi]TLD96206.1 molybdopterin-guanine dinucleotide biosynthesis protein B [Helicobacter jaachi]